MGGLVTSESATSGAVNQQIKVKLAEDVLPTREGTTGRLKGTVN